MDIPTQHFTSFFDSSYSFLTSHHRAPAEATSPSGGGTLQSRYLVLLDAHLEAVIIGLKKALHGGGRGANAAGDLRQEAEGDLGWGGVPVAGSPHYGHVRGRAHHKHIHLTAAAQHSNLCQQPRNFEP